MKIRIFSDLHADVHLIAPDVDLVIAAGDANERAIRAVEGLRRIIPLHIPVAMVLGNSEYYQRGFPDELNLASQAGKVKIG